VYTLAIVYTILLRWMPVASWHGPVQMVFDLILVTCLIYLTGTQIAILFGSIPWPLSWRVFCFSAKPRYRCGVKFYFARRAAELIYYSILPRMQIAVPSSRAIAKPGFSAICSILWPLHIYRVCWRKVCDGQGAELEVKRGELQDLQAFNEDIIHSMRGDCSRPISMAEFFC